MEGRRILIADGSEAFRTALAEELSGFFLVETCGNGKQTLDMIKKFCPDVLVLDMMIPGLDGISLLKSALKDGMRGQILATTRYISDYVAESLGEMGVGYLMVKPCDIHATVERIKDLVEKSRKIPILPQNRLTNVSGILFTLSVPTKLRGYACLREAILCSVQNPDQSITKELYPRVAQLCNGTPGQVERSIRSAIGAAWKNRDDSLWRQYFGSDAEGNTRKPTNAEFIARVADLLIVSGKDK
jgi:CheY-like chemotaxis protein